MCSILYSICYIINYYTVIQLNFYLNNSDPYTPAVLCGLKQISYTNFVYYIIPFSNNRQTHVYAPTLNLIYIYYNI